MRRWSRSLRRSKSSDKWAKGSWQAFLGLLFCRKNLAQKAAGQAHLEEDMKDLLAHDIGTSGDKAALFSVDGHLIASETIPYETFYAQGGAIEQRPQDWWNAVCQATKAVMASIDPAQVAAVCFGGMGHCCTCLDEQGNFLAPSM